MHDNHSMVTELEIQEVAPGIHELRLPIPFEDGRVNVFLLPDGAEVDLIDCGMNSPESLAMIGEAVKRVAGPSGRLRRLIVTHIHPDHYGAAGDLVSQGTELFLHRLEVPMVHPRYLELEQLIDEVGHYLLANGVPEAEAELMSNSSRALGAYVTAAPDAVELDGAETIRMGERELRVVWTPGHSPGHVCLFDPEARILFGGDQLLPDASPNIGLHPQSTPNPLDDFLESLAHLARLEPRLVLPSHGRPFAGAQGRVDALVAHHARQKDRILALTEGRDHSGWEVALARWGERQYVYEKRLALQEALAHLQSLAVAGVLVKTITRQSVTWRAAQPA